MLPPIVLTAFGTSSAAKPVFDLIEQDVTERFPDHPLFWAFSSKRLVKKSTSYRHPLDVLEELHQQEINHVIVQSLHLLPGKDFHTMITDLRRSPVKVSLGMPLLYSERDVETAVEVLLSALNVEPDSAILLLGHGTDHPTWTFYPALQNYLQQRTQARVFLGVVEKSPNSDGLENTIRQAGYSKVTLLPFFLLLGMHYNRDIIGEGEESWFNRLNSAGITVNIVEKGLASSPLIRQLFCDHIEEAINRAT